MAKDRLCRGIDLAKAGKNAEAKNILAQVVQDDPQSTTGWFWLAKVVETREQQKYCLEKTLRLDPQNKAARQALAQTRSKTARPEKSPQQTQDFKRTIASLLDPLGCKFYCAGESIEGQPSLLDICQEIFAANFGIFDLSLGNPNAYLKLGIALGLNRPIVVTAREGISLAWVLREHNVITYADHSALKAQLARLCSQGFPPAAPPTPDYCYFCDRVCESMATPPDENSYLVLNRSKLLWRNLMQSLTPHLASHHLYPAYLTDRGAGPALCEVRRKVLASQFALCHLGALSDESSFLALGIAIGSRTPWILLSQKDNGDVPSILRGVDKIEYETFADLETPLMNALGAFLGRIKPKSPVKSSGTALLSLPFWMKLDDWINHVAHPEKPLEKIQGAIQVAQCKGQKYLSKQTIPAGGLLFGRSASCNVVVKNPSVSSRHFCILKGRAGKYFVEDFGKNGTFLNGVRLPPNQRVAITVGDTIRIPGAQFLIWDDRPLPDARDTRNIGVTGMLPPLLQIDIPEISPPTYLNTWNHPLALTVLLPDGHNRSMFEVQTYYPMGKILAELVKLLDLPDREYRLKIKNKLVKDNETPLSLGIRNGNLLIIVPAGAR